MKTKIIRVYVFRHDMGLDRKPRWHAYTRWANPSWEGCQTIDVVAVDGAGAKREAIRLAKMEWESKESKP